MIRQLLIRADANTQIGGGHFMRCLALAQAWQSCGGGVTFLSYCNSDTLLRRIESAGMSFVSVDQPHPDPSDLRETLTLLDQRAALDAAGCWLVVDGYHFSSAYHEAIRVAGHRLLVVDDMAHLPHYHADLLINQNIHAKRLNYRCDADTELLLGTEYVMLRSEFQSWRGWRREIPKIASKVVVSLGSGDSDNVTLKVVQALQQGEISSLQVRVIVGPTNPHLETLRQAASRSTNVQLLIDVTNMPEQLAWADVAVSAGGSTCWELAFMGLPSVLIVMAENQLRIAQALDEARVAVNLGWHHQISIESMVDGIDELQRSWDTRRQISDNARSFVDGKGASRVVEALRSRMNLGIEHAHSISG